MRLGCVFSSVVWDMAVGRAFGHAPSPFLCFAWAVKMQEEGVMRCGNPHALWTNRFYELM